MAHFKIYSKSGEDVRYEGCPTYNGVYLKPSYLEFREICSPTPINWQVGDYIDYISDKKITDELCVRNGYRYKLYDIPQPTKKAAIVKSGESFVYQNVQFFAPTKDLELCPFRDIVPNDNYIHFSTRQDVSTFEDLNGIAKRIEKNLDDWYGVGIWSIRVADDLNTKYKDIVKEARAFSVGGGNCLDALNKCYDVWDEIGWTYSVQNNGDKGKINVITIGAANVNAIAPISTPTLKYGIVVNSKTKEEESQGLTSIVATQSNKDEFATRLYAFGSSRNMNFDYYRSNSNIKNAASLDIQHLMIPMRYWGKTDNLYDPSKAFLENSGAKTRYGVRAKYHYFDGSQDEEIFPSIEGVTIGMVRNGSPDYVPNGRIYPSATERVDYPISAQQMVDDGQLYDAGEKVILPGAIADNVMSWGGLIPYDRALKKTIGSYAFDPTPGKWKITLNANYQGTVPYPEGGISAYVYIERHYTKNETHHEDTLIGFPCETAASKKSFDFKISNAAYEIDIEDIAGATDNQLVFVIQLMYTYQYEGALPIAAQLVTGKNTMSFTLERAYSKTFMLTVKQIGFDISKRQAQGTTGLGTIHFKGGMCAGRSFVIKNCTYQEKNDNWLLECIRCYDESIGMVFPNKNYAIKDTDNFVLLDIAMPDLYIDIAEQKLYDAATQMLASISQVKPMYTPMIDSKMIAQSAFAIQEGMYMSLQDEDLTGVEKRYLIDNIIISENESSIPTYKVTLRDDKSRSFKHSINSGGNSTPLTSLGVSYGGPATSYESLSDIPEIEGVQVKGKKSAEQYNLQRKLVPGENITIEGNVISSKGGGGTPITVDDALSETSTNPVQNKVVTAAINERITEAKADDKYLPRYKLSSGDYGAAVHELGFFESDDPRGEHTPWHTVIKKRTTRTSSGSIDTDHSGLALFDNLFLFGWLSIIGRFYLHKALSDADSAYLEWDEDSKAIKVHGNVYATGYVSSGGVGKSSTSGGDVSCVEVNGSVIYPDGTGKITLPDYPGAGDVLWDDIVNKPAWIGDSKPSYSFSEIGGTLPASRVTGLPDYPDLSKYYNADNANRSDVDWTAKDLNAQRVVIAGHVVEYDTKNDAFKFNGNVYATGFVSAGGTGESGGTSGGIIPTEIPILTTRQMSDTEFFEIAHNGITSSEVAHELLIGQRRAYNSDGDFFTCSGRYTSENHWRLTLRDWGEIMDGGTEIEIRNNNGTINYTYYER